MKRFENQTAGNAIDWIGSVLHLPEWGISERAAGGPTANTVVSPVNSGAGPSSFSGAGGTYSPTYLGTYSSPTTGNTQYNTLQDAQKATQQQTSPPPSAPNPQTRDQGGDVPNVGDIRDGYRWNGKNWEPAYNGFTSYQDMVKNDINTGYDAYFQQLDSILNNDLPAQQSAQLGIAQSQGTQAENTLGSQRTQGLADLATQTRQTEQGQAKSLQDLANDIRNQFKAGQVYLGSRGAGDSSAANQYSYAIAKMGNQARGNVMQQTAEIKNQIADREFKLNQTYNTELNNIKESVNQKTLEIANWFSQAQSQLKQAKAQGQLQKGQDLANLSKQLLQNATQQLLYTQQQAAARQDALSQWAMNNSTTINQLKSNLAQVSAYQAPGVVNPGVQGQLSADTSGNLAYNQTPGTGYGVTGVNSKDWLKQLYGSTA